MILMKVLAIILAVWFSIFLFAVLFNKLLLFRGINPKHPYEIFARIKRLRFKNICLDPFKLAFTLLSDD